MNTALNTQRRGRKAVISQAESLQKATDRYYLLTLVKRVGKGAGFTSKMIQLLDYYMAFTQGQDWQKGSRPIVYQCLAKTALDMGVSERQIQRIEKALFEVGALTWKDSGNHKRYGQRCKITGRIWYAFGVDLSPLADLEENLLLLLEKKKRESQEKLEYKRQISFYRRQINAMVSTLANEKNTQEQAREALVQYEQIAKPIRVSIKLTALKAQLRQHKALFETLRKSVDKTPKASCRNDKNVVHIESSNQSPFDKSKEENAIREGDCANVKPQYQKSGYRLNSNKTKEITLRQVLDMASENFRMNIPRHPGRPITWNDIVEAAYRTKTDLGISQIAWGTACGKVGRVQAALYMLLSDKVYHLSTNEIFNPSGYFINLVQSFHKSQKIT